MLPGATNWIYNNRESWNHHLSTVYKNLETLWNRQWKYEGKTYKSAADRYAADSQAGIGDITAQGALQGLYEVTMDGNLLVTDANTVLTAKELMVGDIQKYVYFRPEADDLSSGVFSGKYNPPPHSVTRSFPPIAFISSASNETKGDIQVYDVAQVALFKKYTDAYTMNNSIAKTVQRELGFIYQDALNVNKSTKVKGNAPSLKSLWGFQFTYNPPSITYGLSVDGTIDWTAYGGSEGDIANQLFGTGTIEIKLLLNRIHDLSVLRLPFSKNSYSWDAGYPRTLSKEDIEGIITRGTEYDLEFLYRTVNGDPQYTPAMKHNTPTSDFGLLYGVPVWLRLHDNMRYKVVLQQLNVNHIGFTKDMIPILSEVSLSFMRIPVITWDSAYQAQVAQKIVTNTTG